MLRKTTDSCHIGVLVSKKTSEMTCLYAVANLFAWFSPHKYVESLLFKHDHVPFLLLRQFCYRSADFYRLSGYTCCNSEPGQRWLNYNIHNLAVHPSSDSFCLLLNSYSLIEISLSMISRATSNSS